MFRLTREVRFAANGHDDRQQQLAGRPTNSYGGFPSLTCFAPWYAVRVTVSGQIDPQAQYLVDIRFIDAVVRDRVISTMQSLADLRSPGLGSAVASIFERLNP